MIVLSHGMEYSIAKSFKVPHSKSVPFNNLNFVVNTSGETTLIETLKEFNIYICYILLISRSNSYKTGCYSILSLIEIIIYIADNNFLMIINVDIYTNNM